MRRKAFYERCGFVENPYPHIHPAYHRDHAGHELVVMSFPKMLKAEEYEHFHRYLQDIVMKDVCRVDTGKYSGRINGFIPQKCPV